MSRPSVLLGCGMGFIGFLGKDFPNLGGKTFAGRYFSQPAESEEEEVERRRGRMRGGEVRYFYYLLRVPSPFISPLQSVLPPFSSLLDLCFSISLYANKPRPLNLRGPTTWRGEGWGGKYQRIADEGGRVGVSAVGQQRFNH